ncbi:hypothetical protein ACTS94_02715 [Empedobacter falsenii]
MINQNPTITAENSVEEITKQVKHYPSEKIYAFTRLDDFCYFEVFINDILVAKSFDQNIADAFLINHLINKTGEYKITYKLYPLGNNNKYNEKFPTFIDATKFGLTLGSYDLKNKNTSDIEYMEYEVPVNEEKITENYSKNKSSISGKTHYEGSFDIKVDVPYTLNFPFENAQDLRKMDKKQLEDKLLKKYKEVASIYQNKELDNIARLEFETARDLYVSNYDSKETIAENLNVLFKEIYPSKSFQVQPIENYKLEYFADGKLVALMQNTMDNRFRGQNALWAKVDYDGGLRPIFINRYYYIPQGETEFKVY